jgi:hypothetical protein
MSEAVKEEVQAPQPGSPEYDAAMSAKVDASASKAAEAASGNDLQVTPPVEAQEASKEAPKEPLKEETKEDTEEAKETLEKAGIDYTKLQAEYDEGGALSEESYKALEAVGFPKDVVDNYVAGQEALAELRILQAAEVVGGKEQLSQMQSWAAKALSPADIEAYNTATMGSKAEMLQAIEGLKSRFEANYGRQPGLLGGSPAGSAGSMGYASRAEMTTDMRNPSYAKDPAFRAKVMAKVAATTVF